MPALQKPRLRPCKHACDSGCSVHSSPKRPVACHTFECIWHAAKERGETAFDLIDRPDFSHVVLGPTDLPNREYFYVHVDPHFPDAWRNGRVGEYINLLRTRGLKIIIMIGDKQWRIHNDVALYGTQDEFAKIDAASTSR